MKHLMPRLILSLFLLSSLVVKAIVPPLITATNTVPLLPSQQVEAVDPQLTYITATPYVSSTTRFPAFYDKTLRNQIVLEIDHDNNDVFLDKPFKIRVELTVEIWKKTTAPGLQLVTSTEMIELDYRPDNVYHDQGILKYTGTDAGYRIRATVNNVYISDPSAPYKIKLRTEVETERYFQYDPAASHITLNHNSTTNIDNAKGLVRLSWTYAFALSGVVTSPAEYDVEWVYIDNAENRLATDVPFSSADFNEKATRVSVSGAQSYYNIPLLYTKGFIVYRIRGKWRTYFDGYTNLVNGEWTIKDDACNTASCKVSDYTSYYTVNASYAQEHEPNLNWQSMSSFAEDGKSKAVVSYFDGTLRNRQTVEKLIKNRATFSAYSCDFDNTTRASEIFYDYTGRPAINALPVPTDLQKIKFNRMLNTYKQPSTNSLFPYQRKYFDIEGNACFTGAEPMSDSSGSSKYYSPKHVFPDCSPFPEENYLPDAKLYPFTQTIYTPDNTNRIAKQSGLGSDYKIGSGKESKYFYAQPLQAELDRLFGSDVGYESHYKKTMVVDANGQASVSYIDPQGKTIATNLTGVAPVSLYDLDGRTSSVLTVDLLGKTLVTDFRDYQNGGSKKNVLELENKRWVMNRDFLVESEQIYYFGYELKSMGMYASCPSPAPGSFPVCYNCVLDLNISLTDDCGREYLKGIDTTKPNGNYKQIDADCLPPEVVLSNNIKPDRSVGTTWTSNDVLKKPDLSTDRNGVSGQAFYFNGSSTIIRYGDILDNVFAATPNAIFSVSGWANTTALPTFAGGGMIVTKSWGGSGPYQWSINHDQDGFVKAGVAFTSNASQFYEVKSATAIPAGQWYHFALVFDGSQSIAANRVKIYINGVPGIFSRSVGTTGTTTVNTTQEVSIGGGYSASSPGVVSNPFNGGIDEIRIYNVALTVSEVGLLKDNKSLTYIPQAYWPLDGNTDDHSGNNRNAVALPSSVTLKPGVYKISKTLTVNQQALEAKTQDYLNSACFLPYDTFEVRESQKISTIGCEMTCEQCLSSIGNFDQYDCENPAHDPSLPCLTSVEYDALVSECNQLCEKSSRCSGGLAAMLADVSPGGQYGELIDHKAITEGQVNLPPSDLPLTPYMFKLSVFNQDNYLSIKTEYVNKGIRPSWRYPYTPYVNDLGDEDYVSIGLDKDGHYSPAVTDAAQLIATDDGNFKIRPQFLLNIEDFYKNWKSSWANSLVYYHPEYPYYELCVEQSASNDFDDDWMNLETYNDAVDKYGTLSNGLPAFLNPLGFDPYNPCDTSPDNAIDPYFKSDNPRFDMDEYVHMIKSMEKYMEVSSGSGKTIWELAYQLAACPDNNIACSSNPCPVFSYDISSGCYTTFPYEADPVKDAAIKDKFWQTFRMLYLSLKQRFQERRLAKIAIEEKNSYNGCIGADPFDIAKYNFNTTPAANASWYSTLCPSYSGTSQYYNLEQPCNWSRFEFYKDKVQRFPGATASVKIGSFDAKFKYDPDEEDFYVTDDLEKAQAIKDESENMADLALYKQCGKCPLAADMEALLSAMFIGKPQFVDPEGPNVLLGCNALPELTPELLNAFSGTTTLPDNDPYTLQWDFSSIAEDGPGNEQTLSGNFICSVSGYPCELNLQFVNPSPQYAFNKIRSFCCIKYIPDPLHENKAFELTAVLETDSSKYEEVKLTGYTSCIDIANCSFKPICKTSAEAGDLMLLFNALIDAKTPQPAPPTPPTPPLNVFSILSTSISLAYNVSYPRIEIPQQLQYLLDVKFPDINAVYKSLPCGTAQRPLRDWNWQLTFVSATPTVRTYVATITAANNKSCGITFKFPAPYDPEDIIRFTDLKVDEGNGPMAFVMKALVEVTPGVFDYITVPGSSTCINIGTCDNDLQYPYEAGKGKTETLYPSLSPLAIAMLSAEVLNFSAIDNQGYFNADKTTGKILPPPGEGQGGGTTGPNLCKGHAEFYPMHGNYKFSDIVSLVNMVPDYERTATTGNVICYVQMSDGKIIPLRVHFFECVAFTLSPCRFTQYVYNGDFTVDFPSGGITPSGLAFTTTGYAPNTTGLGSCSDPGTYFSGPTTMSCTELAGPTYLTDHTNSSISGVGSKFIIYRSSEEDGRENVLLSSNLATVNYGQNYIFKLYYLNASVFDNPENFIKVNIKTYDAVGTLLNTRTLAYKKVLFDPHFKWNELSFTWEADAPQISIEIISIENSQDNYIALDDISFGQQCPCISYLVSPVNFYDKTNITMSPFGEVDVATINMSTVNAVSATRIVVSGSPDVTSRTYGASGRDKILGYTIDNTSRVLWTNTQPVENEKSYDFSLWFNTNTGSQPALPSGVELILKVNGVVLQQLVCDPANKWNIIKGTWNSGNENKAILTVEAYSLNPSGFSFIALDEIEFRASCPVPGCFPVFPQPQILVTENPCELNLTNIIKNNAVVAYRTYIEQLKHDFQTNYIKECLNVYETFLMKYTDPGDHYTLYYYDQSGNLVRTIPPKGVNKLDNSLLDAVKADRLNNTRTVYTAHSYATTYKYNSLDQLVSQSVPDNDNMDKWSTFPRNTLEGGGTVNTDIYSMSFSSVYSGMALGNTLGSSPAQGFVYKTGNNGTTWELTSAKLGVDDLTDVYVVNSTKAYALSTEGYLLISTDGAVTWSIKSVPSAITDKAIRFCYNTTTGEIAIIFISGTVYKTTDEGATWSSSGLVSGGISSGDWIKDVSLIGNNGLAITNEGKIYRTTARLTSPWTQLTGKTVGLDLNCIQRVSQYQAIAAGNNGVILSSSNNGSSWTEIASNITQNITEVYYQDNKKGWMLDDAGALYQTADGGSTWAHYNDAASVSPIADFAFTNDNDGFAIRQDGTMIATTNGGQSWLPFKTAPAMGSGQVVNKMVVKESGELLCMSSDGSDFFIYHANPNQGWVLITQPGSTPAGIPVTGLFFNSGVYSGTPYCTAIIMSTTGSYYTLEIDLTTNSAIRNFSSGFGMTAICFTGGVGYGLIGTSMYQSFDGGDSWSPYATITAATNTRGLLVEAVTPTVLRGITIGEAGSITRADDILGTWTVTSTVISPPAFNAVKVVNNKGYLLGEKGTIYLWDPSTPNTAKEIMSAASDNLSDLYADLSTMTVLTVGSNSTVVSGVLSGTGDITWNTSFSNMGIAGGEQLQSITYASPAIGWMVTTASGKVYHYISGAWFQKLNANTNLHTTHFGSGIYLCGGKGGSMYKWNTGTSTWGDVSNIKLPVLNDIQYLTASTAIIAGNNGTIFKTTNANEAVPRWSLIRSGVSTNLNAVSFMNTQKGLIVGDAGKILYSVNGGSSWDLIVQGSITGKLNDVQVLSGNFATMVGDVNTIYFNTTDIATPTWVLNTTGIPANSNNVYSVCFTDSKHGFAVGQNDAIYKYDLVSGVYKWTKLTRPTGAGWPGTTHLKAVYFNDYYTGYFVGSGGFVMRTSNGGTTFENVTTYPLNTAMNIKMNDINAIAYANADNIFLGGIYVAAATQNKTIYKLGDGKDLFSSHFYYDKLGRLVASQNAVQFKKSVPASNQYFYSYSVYDSRGRIKESGEKTAAAIVESVYDNYGRIDDALLNSWITSGAAGTRKEVTRTYYDDDIFSLPITLENTINRVIASTYEAVNDNADASYDFATHYSYDIHGNVKTLLQEFASLPITAGSYEEFKRVDYSYDLISGKVNKVSYQEGKADQFFHKYEYDEENKLTHVYTSTDDLNWHQDARYFYYRHGPLARIELGDDKIQGTDYAYAIQGWLKGINSNTVLSPSREPGKDGHDVSANTNRFFAKDEIGFSLNYYVGDYSAINSPDFYNQFEASLTQQPNEVETATRDLFNGNISHMVTGIRQFMPQMNSRAVPAHAMVYNYDILNRIREATMYDDADMDNNMWKNEVNSHYYMTAKDYAENIQYDRNGNIQVLNRNSRSIGQGDYLMDQLVYNYYDKATYPGNYPKNTNKLSSVLEVSGVILEAYDGDMEPGQVLNPANYTTGNYQYDEIGNLIKDVQEEIGLITWTVSGKIKTITRSSGSQKPDLEFSYDAQGNRVVKIEKPAGSSSADWKYTVYVRDAQGNILSTYTLNTALQTLEQQNTMIYGSNRLGELENNTFEKNDCGITPAGLGDIQTNEDIDNWNNNAMQALFGFDDVTMADYNEQFRSMFNPLEIDRMTLLKMMNKWAEFMCKLHCCQITGHETDFENTLITYLHEFVNQLSGTGLFDHYDQDQWQTAMNTWKDYEIDYTNEIKSNFPCNEGELNYTNGSRQYELANHLGNVLTTISDRKVETTAMVYEDNFDHETGWVIDDTKRTTLSYGKDQLHIEVTSVSGSSKDRVGIRKLIPTVPGENYRVRYLCSTKDATLTLSNIRNVDRMYLEQRMWLSDKEEQELMFTAEGFTTEIGIIETNIYKGFTLDINYIRVEKVAAIPVEPGNYVINHTFTGGVTPASLGWTSCSGGLTLQNAADKFYIRSSGGGPSSACLPISLVYDSERAYHMRFNVKMTAMPYKLFVQFGADGGMGTTQYLINGNGWHDLYFKPQGDPQIQFKVYSDAVSAYSYTLDDISIELIKIPTTIDYRADTRTSTDYFAFGSTMPARIFDASQNASAVLFQDFAMDDGNFGYWTLLSGAADFYWDNKQLHVQQKAGSEIGKVFPTVVGRRYRVTLDLAQIEEGEKKWIYFYVRNDVMDPLAYMYQQTDLARRYTFEFIAKSPTSYLTASSFGSEDLWYNLDNIKVVDISDEYDGYRFGFNGKENDNEVSGSGNQQDYGMRIYNNRLGRFLSVDPLAGKYAFISPYAFAENSPVAYVDLDGQERYYTANGVLIGSIGTSTQQRRVSNENIEKVVFWINAARFKQNDVKYVDRTATYANSLSSVSILTHIKIPKIEYTLDDEWGEPNIAGDGQPGEGKAQVNGMINFWNSTMDFIEHPIENVQTSFTDIAKMSTHAYSEVSTNGVSFMSKSVTDENRLQKLEAGYSFAFASSFALTGFGAAKPVTTPNGFLFKGFTIKTPFNIPVQRFGNMSLGRADFWGLRLGTNTFVNRTLGAIKPSWNPLTQYTTGIIPKGTPIQFGIIGPQGLAFPGGSIQFILDSKSVINQTSKFIPR